MIKTKVLIADTNEAFAVQVLNAANPRIEIHEIVYTIQDLLRILRKDPIHAVFLNPKINLHVGINPIQIIRTLSPVTKVYIVTERYDAEFVQDQILSGAKGVLLKTDDNQDLIRTMNFSGRLCFSSSISVYEEFSHINPLRFLLIDDFNVGNELVTVLLKNFGHIVDAAVDGLSGLKFINSQPYDIIITDINMPRISGTELITAVRQSDRNATVPVLVLSSVKDQNTMNQALRNGATAWLSKPFEAEKLLTLVIKIQRTQSIISRYEKNSLDC